MSYIPNLTALPLHEILLDNGYVINKNKHSKNNPCLKHENEEGSLVLQPITYSFLILVSSIIFNNSVFDIKGLILFELWS
ncbi:hypothetical protein KVL05_07400 [Helicobacter pylori]|nr:hypothetical protein KVL05_07400 [Helicobacter pylori]